MHGAGDLTYDYDAVAAPIILSTTFHRATDNTYPFGYEYARDANPNRGEFETRMARLEGGVGAAAFASGMAATLAAFQVLAPGDHVVVSEDCYFGVRESLTTHFASWGLEVTLVDVADLRAVQAAMRDRTRIVFVESPSNPMIRVCDLVHIGEVAHRAGALLVCDNTFATPLFQRPFDHGADVVVHSTTKYVSGHHDAQAGIIIAREPSPYWSAIKNLQRSFGAVPSAFTCWLSSRGLATLPCRVRQQSATALTLATRLSVHPGIVEVLHPGLPASPYHEMARRQMTGFGSVFSIRVRGGEAGALSVAARVALFQRATSFGGPESLLEHRASIEEPGTKTPRDLLRLAIGLEDVDDLTADLVQALDRNSKAPAVPRGASAAEDGRR